MKSGIKKCRISEQDKQQKNYLTGTGPEIKISTCFRFMQNNNLCEYLWRYERYQILQMTNQ